MDHAKSEGPPAPPVRVDPPFSRWTPPPPDDLPVFIGENRIRVDGWTLNAILNPKVPRARGKERDKVKMS